MTQPQLSVLMPGRLFLENTKYSCNHHGISGTALAVLSRDLHSLWIISGTRNNSKIYLQIMILMMLESIF